MDVVRHRIGGVTFEVAADLELPELTRGNLAKFLTGKGPVDVTYQVRRIPGDPGARRPLDASAEGAEILRHVAAPAAAANHSLLGVPEVTRLLYHALTTSDDVSFEVNDACVQVKDFSRQRFHLLYAEPGPMSEAELQEHLVTYYRASHLLLWRRLHSVVIHSACVIRNRQAALFLAASGGGKTTVTKCADSADVVGDDRVVLRLDAGRVVAHGNPYGRLTSGPAAAEVAAVFLLEKGAAFAVRPISWTEAFSFFLQEHLRFMVTAERSHRVQMVDVYLAVCRQARTYVMTFPRHFVDWSAVEAVMAGEGDCDRSRYISAG